MGGQPQKGFRKGIGVRKYKERGKQRVVDGKDISKPMEIDIQFAVAEELTAKLVAAGPALKLEFRTSTYFEAGENGDHADYNAWTCECTNSLVLTYGGLITAQSALSV